MNTSLVIIFALFLAILFFSIMAGKNVAAFGDPDVGKPYAKVGGYVIAIVIAFLLLQLFSLK